MQKKCLANQLKFTSSPKSKGVGYENKYQSNNKQQVNFSSYYCDSQLSSLKQIKKVINDYVIANNLWNGPNRIKKQYDDFLFFNNKSDVFIKSKKSNGKIENITDIIADVDVNRESCIMLKDAIAEPDCSSPSLKSTHSITSTNGSDKFVEEVINAQSKLLGKLLDIDNFII